MLMTAKKLLINVVGAPRHLRAGGYGGATRRIYEGNKDTTAAHTYGVLAVA